MRTNLSSQITLKSIPAKYYKPENAFERSVLTRYEKIPADIYENAEDGAVCIAKKIANAIEKAAKNNRTFVMALPGGNSPKIIYDELVRLHKEDGLSFANVVVFNLYEYYPLAANAGTSNFSKIKEQFLNHVDVKAENVYTIDTTVSKKDVAQLCKDYEKKIAEVGGLDVVLLGVGQEGNFGLNEPGSQINSRTRLLLLNDTSRQEAAKTFGGTKNVPESSVTMGVGTVLNAKKIYLFAWGEEKATVIQKTLEEPATDAVPSSFLQNHNNILVIADLEAASKLTRLCHPWLVTSCEWDNKLIRSAVVWLCLLKAKPILKLTNQDYNENGLSELLSLYGSAYNVNIKVFNDLQHTITGWPGGKPNADDTNRPERATPYPKRVVVFSPHPDDDVISMGGTVHRLAVHGHDVHVAYETSGNIAVADEEVNRFLMFVKGYNEILGLENKQTDKQFEDVKTFFDKKKDGDNDLRSILEIKALIRRGEARTAALYAGVKYDNIHFLNLPFYETGKIEKSPISEADINIVRNFLKEVQPHQIFVAGDLADPHGTHRVCTDAVLAAIDEEKKIGAEWLQDCRIWMYRGAWAEWEIENIEMAVPMSPEELRYKRNTILKHQSQMEGAPFLGNDERLFWQRSEDRNRGTAELYHKLGLACYEAIEAFVEYVPL